MPLVDARDLAAQSGARTRPSPASAPPSGDVNVTPEDEPLPPSHDTSPVRGPVTGTAGDTPAAWLDCAHTLADLSAAAITPFFRQSLTVDDKSGTDESGRRGFDPVTAADRAAEEVMRAQLARTYPTHTIVGEEMADRPGRADRRWIIDPIDGTRAFIMGYPLWGTLIGLADGTTPLLGLMNQPFTGERFWSEGGRAYWRRRQPGQVDTQRTLATRRGIGLGEAILTATTPDMFDAEETAKFARVRRQARLTRFGGDCYGYAMVAMGLVDVVIEASLKPFDIAALIPIIEGAGGQVTNWTGGPALATSDGRVVASGDPRLHETILKLLAA